MKLFFSTTLSTVLTGGMVSCAGTGAPDTESPGTVVDGLSSTTRGEIRVTDEKHDRLGSDRADGFHSYAFSGKAGATVNFVLSSHSFRTHLLIIGPNGHRWNVPGTLFVYSESQAWREITLPQDGAYRVLVTSHDNLASGRAVSSGEYFLEVFAPSISNQAAGSRVARGLE